MMIRSEAAREIIALLEEAVQLGGRKPSGELIAYLTAMAEESSVSDALTAAAGSSSSRRKRVAGGRPRRPRDGVDMSKTIAELAEKLRNSFDSDSTFEAVIQAPELQKLTKSNVVILYNKVFETSRTFAKSLTKPDLLNAIRRERINRVRSRS